MIVVALSSVGSLKLCPIKPMRLYVLRVATKWVRNVR